MSNAVRSILRSFNKNHDKLNIILFNFYQYEKYNVLLAETGHNFYLWTSQFPGQWTNRNVQKPPNIFHLHNKEESIDQTIDFDLIIIHNRFNQYDLAARLAHSWHIPLIIINHDQPIGPIITDNGMIGNIDTTKSHEVFHRRGDINIYDSEMLRNNWKDLGKVIKPGINNKIFKKNQDRDIVARCLFHPSVDNNLNNFIIQTISQCMEPVPLQPGNHIQQYQQADFFFNADIASLNISVLEAMSCGLIPITIKNNNLTNIISNKNGFILEDFNQLTQVLDKLKRIDPLSKRVLGDRARQTIVNEFPLETFRQRWNNVLHNCGKIFFKR
jgi:hypothetical protein